MDMENSVPSLAVFMKFTARLGSAMCWVALGAAHALLLALASIALWAFQVSPQAAGGWMAGIATSSTTAVLALVFGGSLLGAWIYAMQKTARAMHRWLWKHLNR
ncbi:hypothetical protein [Pseudoxanthomonas beigongshangi]